MSVYSFTGTYTNAVLCQMQAALQSIFGADNEDELVLVYAEIRALNDGLEDAAVSALRLIWDLKPGEGEPSEERVVRFTGEQLDEISDALKSHIGQTEDLTDKDFEQARIGLIACETRF